MKKFFARTDDQSLRVVRRVLPDAEQIDDPRALAGSDEPAVLVVRATAEDAGEVVASLGDDPSVAVVVAAEQGERDRVVSLVAAGADGVLMLDGPQGDAELSLELAQRIRARRVEHLTELNRVRAQLMRFADDFRQSYRREVERATELADSLFRLQSSYRDTVVALAAAVEAKDATTGHHLERVSRSASALAKIVDPELAADPFLSFGFLLHDVGKIGVPDRVLLKPGPLTEAEYARMRAHADIGARIVQNIEFLHPVREIIRHHHERWDGEGYPDGLRRGEIPRAARIFSVADAVDAMLHDRPYRRALSLERATDEVLTSSGSQFDPEVVEAFVLLVESEDGPFRVHAE